MRKKYNLNNEILKQMKKIYYYKGCTYLDWMGFPITPFNKPSYHHIKKASELKDNKEDYTATIENGAFLGKNSHDLLHIIERIDNDLYNTWNSLFLLINKGMKYPSEEIWNTISVLKEKTILKIQNNEIKKR